MDNIKRNMIIALSIILISNLAISCKKLPKKKYNTTNNFINNIQRSNIQLMAINIFKKETGIVDPISCFCVKNRRIETPHGSWLCDISEQGKSTEDGKFQPIAPDTGQWFLFIDFVNDSYKLEKLWQVQE